MSQDKCVPRITANCVEQDITAAASNSDCVGFSVCLPFGATLSNEGGCMNYTPGTPPEDGVYSKIVLVNGCITGLEKADIPIYTSAPCAPPPSPCDCDGEGSLPDPSTTAGNLFRYDAAGRPLVTLSVTNGPGISITGTGTVADPLVISCTVEGGSNIFIQSGNNPIIVAGTGTAADPFKISHREYLSGSYAGFTFEYGHATAYTAPSEAGTVRGIVQGDGIKVDANVNTGVYTISLADPANIITGTFQLGGFELEFSKNRLVNIAQTISAVSGTYRWGLFDVTINDLGSVTDVVPIPVDPSDPTNVTTSASKRFPTTGENTREFTIVLERDASFRISYISTNIPADTLLFVDNVNISGDLIPATSPHHFEAIAPALYAAGEHSILLQSNNNEAGFTSVGYLTVTLTTVR